MGSGCILFVCRASNSVVWILQRCAGQVETGATESVKGVFLPDGPREPMRRRKQTDDPTSARRCMAKAKRGTLSRETPDAVPEVSGGTSAPAQGPTVLQGGQVKTGDMPEQMGRCCQEKMADLMNARANCSLCWQVGSKSAHGHTDFSFASRASMGIICHRSLITNKRTGPNTMARPLLPAILHSACLR